MINYALGHLPIELKITSSQIQIIPRYYPKDDDFFGKIYYKANHLYLCLELESARYKFIKRNMHKYDNDNNILYNYKKKIHTKFYGAWYWTPIILNNTYIVSLNDIYNQFICRCSKPSGFKFKIRATYRYDWKPIENAKQFGNPLFHCYNKARTNVFSNEMELTLP